MEFLQITNQRTNNKVLLSQREKARAAGTPPLALRRPKTRRYG